MLGVQEQLQAQVDSKGIHCPYGCTSADHVLIAEVANEPVMYCCHLVGFTNDRKVIEMTEPVYVPVYDDEGFKTDKKRWSGGFRVSGRKRQYVKKTDVLVNPQYLQLDARNGNHMAEKWASARVYRNLTEAEVEEWRLNFIRPQDRDLGPPPIEDAETPAEKKARLKAELAALEAADAIEPEPEAPYEDEYDEKELDALTAPAAK